MRYRSVFKLFISCVLGMLLPLTVLAAPALADMGPWAQVNADGFGAAANDRIWVTAEYKGQLYAGVRNATTGCRVLRFDGGNWVQVNADGFGNPGNNAIFSMTTYGGYLFAGTCNAGGPEIWRTAAAGGSPYTDWVRVGAFAVQEVAVLSLAVYGQYLYAGTANNAAGTSIWRTAGAGGPPYTDWVQVNVGGFGNAQNIEAWCMTVFKSRLYVGVGNWATGCEVWSTAAAGGPPFADWVRVSAPAFGGAANTALMARSMAVKGSYLYVGADNYGGAGVGSVWRTSATGGPPYTDWAKVCANGFGDAGNVGVSSLATDGSYLFAGTRNNATGTEVWRSACSEGPPFADWQQVNASGFGAAANIGSYSLRFFNENLFAAVSNDTTGVEVWRSITSYPTWYLAEGSTAWGFSEYISIANPNNTAVNCAVTYNTTGGPVNGPNVPLPPYSQATLDPAALLGSQDFSTRVTCLEGRNIAVDRTMTWTGSGTTNPEGHNSVGVTAPSTNWYLPEGSSEWGFESWLLIQNPGHADATCNVTYMIEGGAPQTITRTVPANSRRTYSMEDDIGRKDASIMVESNLPVIPERAMYRNDRREGHDSIGTTTAAHDYYLAEGTSAWGFATYVLVQNPNPTPTEVTVTYMTPAGPKPQVPFNMPANSRRTIRVNDQLPNTDFSTRVTGSMPIIAERAMYWNNGTGEACHDSVGMDAPHAAFLLPDGEASGSHETWTLVQNPNTEPVAITVSYFTPSGAGNTSFNDTVPANSRKTYSMANSIAGRASIRVACTTPGKKIMVERAMYWNGRDAGTDTIGGGWL